MKELASNFPEFQETEIELPSEALAHNPGNLMDNAQLTTLGGAYNLDIPMVREKVRVGVSPDFEVLGRETTIHTADVTVGTLEQVFVDAVTHALIGLVVRQGTIFTKQVEIPVSHVKLIRNDDILVTNIEERISKMTNENDNDNVEYSARQENQPLSQETALVSDITDRLAADSWTRDAVIEVISDRSTITLSGWVDNVETRKAAEEIARQTPGVLSVVNELQVEPERKQEPLY